MKAKIVVFSLCFRISETTFNSLLTADQSSRSFNDSPSDLAFSFFTAD